MGRKTEAEKRNSEKVRKEKRCQAADREQRAECASANDPSRSEVKGHLTIPFLRLSEHPSSLSQPRPKCPDTPPPRTQGCPGPQCPGGHTGSPAATSDLSGQLVSTVNAGAQQGPRGEQPGAPAPALAPEPRPCKAGPGDLTERGAPWELGPEQLWPQWPGPSLPPPTVPSREPAVSDSGQGLCGTQQGWERLLMQAGAGRGAQATPGGPPGPRCGCVWASKAAAAHLQTACGRQRRTRDHAGEGQNRTEENSEEPGLSHCGHHGQPPRLPRPPA